MSSKRVKLTINSFSHSVSMDPNYASTTWALLRSAIQEIHNKNASGLSFEELYRNAYNMVLHKYGEALYKGLQQVVEQHLKDVAGVVAAANDDNFLEELNDAWKNNVLSMIMIRDILMYMDRVYVMQNDVPTVYDLGLMLFRDNVVHHPKIRDRLRSTLLALVEQERQGELINRRLVKNVTQMLIDLGVNSRSVYENDFEKEFLEMSSRFYRAESQQFINTNSCSDYMKKVEQRLREEMDRVAHYLDASTEQKIREVVERELIAAHMETLINKESSGLIWMVRDNKIEDLHRMYALFKCVSGGLELMRTTLATYVQGVGREIVTDEVKYRESRETFVPALLEMKDKYDVLLKDALDRDRTFQHALNQAFEYFINLNPKSPEFISLFIDDKLKRGLKGVSEDEVESILDKVMMLFRFLQEKDVFEKYYKQHLAKRLLLGRSVSDDAERGMIQKLKVECGNQFTSKLEGMFTDMRLSADTMEGFKTYLSAQSSDPLGGVDLNVHVLTTGFWPTQNVAKCHLPPEIVNCCETFRRFYMTKHNGRRLTWQTNMGTADLKAVFAPGRKHELSVSTYQMVILLLFNEAESLTFKEIRQQTEIQVPELKRNLLALSCGKYRVLEKTPRTKKCSDSDVYKFNSGFKARLYRVRILTVSQRETAPERADTRDKVNEDRRHQIEAAIVRTMKARKKLTHPSLIAEVTKQLSSRFIPQPQSIKKRIESLIEREYLERAADRRTYHYLA